MQKRFLVLPASCAALLTLGCVGDAAAPGGDGGIPDTSVPDTSSVPDTGLPDTAPPRTHTIGGVLRFLEEGGTNSVVLVVNGGADLTLTKNGPFTFAGTVNEGSSYQVTVKTQPPGQLCTVRNGTDKGTATGDVNNLVVGCTIAIESSANDIASLKPITFTTDVAGKALLTLMFPELAVPQFGAYTDVSFSLSLDGAQVAASYYGNQPASLSSTQTLYAISAVGTGSHTLTAAWTGGGPRLE